jgi:hypothetical protein
MATTRPNRVSTARADLGFDPIRTELRSRGNDGSRRLGQEAFERLQNLTAGFHFQHSFHAGADFGICTLQQGRALVRIPLLRRVVKIFDLAELLRCHTRRVAR